MSIGLQTYCSASMSGLLILLWLGVATASSDLTATKCVWDTTRMSQWAGAVRCSLNPKYVYSQDFAGENSPAFRSLRHDAYQDEQCNKKYTARDSCTADMYCSWSNVSNTCHLFVDPSGSSYALSLACRGSRVWKWAQCGVSGSKQMCGESCFWADGGWARRCLPREEPFLTNLESFYTSLKSYNTSDWGSCPGRVAAMEMSGKELCWHYNSTSSCNQAPGCTWTDNTCKPGKFGPNYWRGFQDTAKGLQLLAAMDSCDALPKNSCEVETFSMVTAPRPDDLTNAAGQEWASSGQKC